MEEKHTMLGSFYFKQFMEIRKNCTFIRCEECKNKEKCLKANRIQEFFDRELNKITYQPTNNHYYWGDRYGCHIPNEEVHNCKEEKDNN